MEWWQWLLVLTGAVLLAISLAVYVVVQWLKWKLKKMFGGWKSAFTRSPIPQTVDLIAAPDLDLSKHALLNENIAAAKELGFEIGGPFMLEEQPGLILMTMSKPVESISGTIVDAGPKKVVIDFVTAYTDGTDLTHTTLEDQGFDRPPHRPFVRLPQASLGDLYKLHLAERPTEGMRNIRLDELPALIKDSVENDWFWRAARGGISETELDRHMEIQRRRNPPPADEDPNAVKTARTMVRSMIVAHARVFIEKRLRETLLNSTSLNAKEWADVDSRLIYVYPHADYSQIAYLLKRREDHVPETPTPSDDHERYRTPEERALADGDARAVFAELNEKLDPSRRLTKLQKVTIESKFSSITADVYVRPSDPEMAAEY